MAVTIEDLYRCYGVLADAKDPSQVGGGPPPGALSLLQSVTCLNF